MRKKKSRVERLLQLFSHCDGNGYWGGAAKAAEKWLERSFKLLSAGNWKEAAYAIGVLSHYFTDPFMPLHTGQSARETIVHRPLEWSVCCSYQSIFKMACEDSRLDSFVIAPGSNWITDAVLRGATMANQYYEPLIDDYDIRELSRHPELALGFVSKGFLSRIFTWVITGWGGVIDRIANESSVSLPNSSLLLPTLLAGVQIPMKRMVAAIESAEQRREVESILDEYQRTGNVVCHVSPEQLTVRKVRRECPGLRPNPLEMQSVIQSELLQSLEIQASKVPTIEEPTRTPQTELNQVDSLPSLHARKMPIETPQALKISAKEKAESEQTYIAKRTQITISSPIVDAPAIGPKTAARFEAIGVATIEDLLSRDAEWISNELNAKWITTRLVTQWQDQAKLACQIKRLSAAGSGLLVMAGIRSAQDLARRTPSDINSPRTVCTARSVAL